MSYFNYEDVEVEYQDKWFKRFGKIKQQIEKKNKYLTLKT